jgi:hypothetical protein
VASGPAQPPEPVQDVALVELHVSVEAPPLLTAGGAALIDAVGCGGGLSLPPHAVTSSAAATGKKRMRERRPHCLQTARITSMLTSQDYIIPLPVAGSYREHSYISGILPRIRHV